MMATPIASCVLSEETLEVSQLMYEPTSGNGSLKANEPFTGTVEA